MKRIEHIPLLELKIKILKLGKHADVAKKLGYKKSYLRKILSGENPQTELFLRRLIDLENGGNYENTD